MDQSSFIPVQVGDVFALGATPWGEHGTLVAIERVENAHVLVREINPPTIDSRKWMARAFFEESAVVRKYHSSEDIDDGDLEPVIIAPTPEGTGRPLYAVKCGEQVLFYSNDVLNKMIDPKTVRENIEHELAKRMDPVGLKRRGLTASYAIEWDENGRRTTLRMMEYNFEFDTWKVKPNVTVKVEV